MASTFSKKAGAPAGTVRISVAGNDYVFTDGGSVAVDNLSAEDELSRHPFLTKTGSTSIQGSAFTPKYATGRDLRLPTMEVFGHSISSGGDAYPNTFDGGWWQRVAEHFHVRRVGKFAQGGAVLGWPTRNMTGDGGVPKILQTINPGVQVGGRRLPSAHAVFLGYGLNDLAAYGTAQANIFRQCLRIACSRARAGSVYEESDASVTYPTGTWSAPANNGAGSGLGIKGTGAPQSSFQIAVPADFEGGTIGVGLMTHFGAAGAIPAGCKVTYTIDGAAAGTGVVDDTVRDAAGLQTSGYVLHRFTGLTPGAHTVVGTIDAGANCYFDYWQIESNFKNPIIIPTLHEPALPSYWSGWLYGAQQNRAGWDAFNAIIQEVAAEFGNVIVPDMEKAGLKAARLNSDGVHPTDEGHGRIAQVIIDAIVEAGIGADMPAMCTVPDRRAWINPTLVNGWSSYWTAIMPALGYTKDQHGIVHVQGSIKKTATPIQQTVFTLPAGFRPKLAKDYSCPTWDGTTWSPGVCRVNPDGTVVPQQSQTTYLAINFSFPAEA